MRHHTLARYILLLLCLSVDTSKADCWELTDKDGAIIQVNDVWHVKSRLSAQAALMGKVDGEFVTVPVGEINAVYLGQPGKGILPFLDSNTMGGEIEFRDGSKRKYQSDHELFYSREGKKYSMPLPRVRSIVRCKDKQTVLPAERGTPATPETQPASIRVDSVLLDNGDELYGNIVTGDFTWKAPYATLSFKRGEILAITLDGEYGLLELRSGDKLSGTLATDRIEITLQYGQRVPLATDMLKSIRFATPSH